jgi:hypothetical protein
MTAKLVVLRASASLSFLTTVLHFASVQASDIVLLTPFIDSAASAVRNLNDYEIMGRKLRVDFSNEVVGDDDNRDRDGAVCAYFKLPPVS